MKFVYAEKLYTDIESQKEFSKILRKLTWNRSVKVLFLVTESLSDAGILEIYQDAELMQPYYKKMKRNLKVWGFSKSKPGAVQLICDILNDPSTSVREKVMSTGV